MAQAHHILVVEDDRLINRAIVDRLSAQGYLVDTVYDGPAAVSATHQKRYDAVILDLMLPGIDGLQVCQQIQATEPIPVLMLTARDSESDRISGLATGADDYLTKPFSPRELVARVAALLRRVERASALAQHQQSQDELHVGTIRLDCTTRQVFVRVALAGPAYDASLSSAEQRGPRMIDNITTTRKGAVLVQEDPGNQGYLAGIFEVNPESGSAELVWQHNPDYFATGGSRFITQDEESSGIIPAPWLGRNAYLAAVQVHAASGDPETVELGQLVVLKRSGR